jgi:hypothetical protein
VSVEQRHLDHTLGFVGRRTDSIRRKLARGSHWMGGKKLLLLVDLSPKAPVFHSPKCEDRQGVVDELSGGWDVESGLTRMAFNQPFPMRM